MTEHGRYAKAGATRLAPGSGLTIGLALIAGFALAALFADFLAPYDYRQQNRNLPNAPPSAVHWSDETGQWRSPFVYASHLSDPLTRSYEENRRRRYSIALFTSGYRYRLFGFIPLDRHLFGLQPEDKEEFGEAAKDSDGQQVRIHLLGTDHLGRDRLSRLLIAARFSLLLAPVSTLLAGALGVFLGALAGYSPRWLDSIISRTVDLVLAMPTLVLVLAVRAVFPIELPAGSAALLLIGCLVALGWAEMARLVRGVVCDLKQRDFVAAAQSLGLTQARILGRHILPGAAPYIGAQLCLMFPAFLLAETTLSFLGAGLQEPEASWGTMLAAAADLTELERESSWPLLAPAAAVVLLTAAFRLLGRELERRI